MPGRQAARAIGRHRFLGKTLPVWRCSGARARMSLIFATSSRLTFASRSIMYVLRHRCPSTSVPLPCPAPI